jgi:hypothetical protein
MTLKQLKERMTDSELRFIRDAAKEWVSNHGACVAREFLQKFVEAANIAHVATEHLSQD